jgi:3(or 17)beta-hydroxysteroid dehydrogenase
MSGRVSGKVAIVTGASRGVGLADAQLLAAEGATVIMTDINAEAGEKAAAEIGASASFFAQDVSKQEDWKALIAKVEADHGRLDILINNAAILQVGDIDSETIEGWQRMMNINADSVFLGIQNAMPLLEKSGGGSIVNMSSSAAIHGMPAFVAYSSAKAAVRGLTKAVAVHCQQKNNQVRCNSIHPDGIATDMPQEIAGDLPPMDETAAMKAVGFMIMPQDVAKTVLFLASDDSTMINGAAIRIDKTATLTPPYI